MKGMQSKLLIVIFLIRILSITNAQENLDNNEMIGFACYIEGRQSKTVKRFAKKLKTKNYKWISKKLSSENNAEKYMSVITLERLSELGKHKLTQTELNLIAEIKQSTELVSVCSGCTYFENVKLKNMFMEEMRSLGYSWLDDNLKTK